MLSYSEKGPGRYEAYLKNATREIERSSFGVRAEAKIPRSSAGVIGNLLFGGGSIDAGDGW